jgi:DNA polymerase-3 subunit epsilon
MEGESTLIFSNFFQSLNKSREPHPLIVANNQFFKGLDKNIPIEECEFVTFDTELSGLNRKKDEIVAIGAIRVKNLQICCGKTFYALVKPEKSLHTDSTLIHQITPQELVEAESLQEVLPRFVEFCGNSFLIGHYVGLDVGFVNRAANKLMGGYIHNPCLDTMRLAMAYKELLNGHYFNHYEMSSSYNLAALSKEYGLPEFAQHDALQDSLQTAYLFLFLLQKLRRSGKKTMLDFLKTGRNWKIIYH